MSAESELAEAVLATLTETLAGEVNGVFEGRQARASAPWVELGAMVAADWGTKDATGREVRLTIEVHDRAERAARTHALAAAAGGAVEDMARDLAGWRIASVAFVRARVSGSRPGEWVASVDYRVRLLASG